MKSLLILLTLFFSSVKTSPEKFLVASDIELKQLTLKGLDKMYNSEHEEAEKIFQQVEAKTPDYPAGAFLKAMNYYWQWFPYKQDDKLKEKMISSFQKATLLSEKEKYKNDMEVMFICFSSDAMLSKIFAFNKENWLAVKHASSSYSILKKGKALTDKYPDFYFSTALYNYYREKYPEIHPVMKPLIYFMEKGDKEKGINQLKLACEKSTFSRVEALSYLVHIYLKYENKAPLALNYLKSVVSKYPGNMFFTARLAETYLSLDSVQASQKNITKLLLNANPFFVMTGNVCQARIFDKQHKWGEARLHALAALNYFNQNKQEVENYKGFIYQILAHVAIADANHKQARIYYQLINPATEYPSVVKEAQEYLQKNKK